MAGLTYWNHQRSDTQQQVFQEAGFVLSDELQGNPNLLASRSQKQIAVVFPDGYFRADFTQITAAEVRFDALAKQDQNYRIHISLKGSDRASVEVLYQNEAMARQALKQLDLRLKD